MKKFALAAVALIGLSGAALSQEAPELAAREAYSQSVTQKVSVSNETTASVNKDAGSSVGQTFQNPRENENYWGR